MANRLVHIKQSDVYRIKRTVTENKNTFFVEIEGKNCEVLSEYLLDISKKFRFPTVAKILDVYDDWMTDLSWLDKEEIAVIINDYTDFLRCDLSSKEKVVKLFEQSILPWWDGEVCNYVVDGKRKSFIVYLVD